LFAARGNFFDREKSMSLRTDDYDYELPANLIARHPLPRREDSRMMVLRRDAKSIEHRLFQHLPEYVEEGDLIVLNNTRVVAARQFSDDGAIEFLFLEKTGAREWKCLVKPGRKMRIGARTTVDGVAARVVEICPEGERIVTFDGEFDPHRSGQLPIPPYLQRAADADDLDRYQTVYASAAGALAAPTAGLHFTPEILEKLPHTFVTLHVGTGTFRPVKCDDLSQHRMHAERFAISKEAAESVNAAHRILAIGTTSVRVLEAAARVHGELVPQENSTEIFIHPPNEISHVDQLLTNFHLPRSTLLMLVAAFAGREFILEAYAAAAREMYRFYSYGDCMLIL
jgi:S-adenosylmethionine:tRNA ribosyltransferase-isomerase